MEIFVGYSFNKEDNWIKDIFNKLIPHFDGKFIDGEETNGNPVTEEVKTRMRNADAYMFILTCRKDMSNGMCTTSDWVKSELQYAHFLNNSNQPPRPIAIFKENKVEYTDTLVNNYQIINFDIEDKVSLILKATAILSDWRRKLNGKRLLLSPPDKIVTEIERHLNKADLECTCQFMKGMREWDPFPVKLKKLGQAVFIDIYDFPSDDTYVKVTIRYPKYPQVPIISWSSSYEKLEHFSFTLNKDDYAG